MSFCALTIKCIPGRDDGEDQCVLFLDEEVQPLTIRDLAGTKAAITTRSPTLQPRLAKLPQGSPLQKCTCQDAGSTGLCIQSLAL